MDKQHRNGSARHFRYELVCLAALTAVFGVSSLAFAQEAMDQSLQVSRASGSAALGYLRNDNVEKALESLGAAADAIKNIHPTEDEGISAAAGGLFRAMNQLDEGERFDLLYKWSMPTDSRKTVRLLTTVVPQVAPPKAFARIIGERPRDETFAVSSVGDIHGLFCSGWVLVKAADEIGRLRRLTTELEQLAADKVPNAGTVLLLAQLADARSDAAKLKTALEQREKRLSDSLSENAATGVATAIIDPSDIAVAAAASTVESQQSSAESMFKSLVEQTLSGAAIRWRSFLRLSHATAVQLARGESGAEAIRQNRLKYWVPISGATSTLHHRGKTDTNWLVHEDHILHLAGSSNDVLFFRYPLTGEFEFRCESQEGGRITTDGGLVYGGLQFEALGRTNQLTIWDADIAHSVVKPCPFVRHEARPTFNRMSIRSNADQAILTANMHPMWFDAVSKARRSPWIGLRSFEERRPMFRNLSITGKPVIPREVRMSDGDDLRGWRSNFFGESQPAFASGSTASPLSPQTGWAVKSGVITADKVEPGKGVNSQSLLHYQRPLLDGESVSYEFEYKPDEVHVHPTLGRLAFLIESGGVQVHWMTSGGFEWTGLPADNALLEPLSRRGPRPLPLKEGDWNSVTLSRADGKVTLTLNDEMIYQRAVDFGGDHSFGFYRDRTKTGVKIRNVVMTGDWPETLPADCVANPAIVAQNAQPSAARHVAVTPGNEDVFSSNARAVSRHAAQLADAEQLDYLARWVLPSETHSTIRMSGAFTRTFSPPANEATVESPASSSGDRDTAHGNLLCPAIDLVQVAGRTGRLAELSEQLAALPTSTIKEQQCAKAAMLFLIHVAKKDFAAAKESALALTTLVESSTELSHYNQWPQTAAAWVGLRNPQSRPLVVDILREIRARQILPRKENGSFAWSEQLSSMNGLLQHLSNGGSLDDFTRGPPLKNWVPGTVADARTDSEGWPKGHWLRTGSQLQNVSTHKQDLLFYRMPLRGDFEVSFDVASQSILELRLMYGGQYVAPQGNHKAFQVGSIRKVNQETLDPQMARPGSLISCRMAVRNNVCTTWYNGRQLHQRQLPEDHDPWLAIRAWSSRNHAAIQNFRIDGTPHVPSEVSLCVDEELTGWWSYFGQAVGPESTWRYIEDDAGRGLVGTPYAAAVGTYYESLLRYYRPLTEDGFLEYDFFCEGNDARLHPALDGVAFLLEPDGISEHPITGGRYDQSGADPAETFVKAEFRRGPAALPLKADAWNHCRLSLNGDSLELSLNDQLIYSRPLDSASERLFGFFRYFDEKPVNVRNVVWRGAWPSEVPDITQQELAGEVRHRVDQKLTTLTTFDHDFAQAGLPQEFFNVPVLYQQKIVPSVYGISHRERSGGEYAQSRIDSWFQMNGDFDVIAEFENLQVTLKEFGGCGIVTTTSNGQHVQTGRRLQSANVDRAFVASRISTGVGRFRAAYDHIVSESTSGRFRLARRDDVYYAFFAEGNSPVFRLIGEQKIDGDQHQPAKLQLIALAHKSDSTSVVWKSVRIAADELMILPNASNQPKVVLYTMNADGSELKQITEDMPEPGGHASPDWSPDGKQIVFDRYTGRAETSHSYVINADGSGLKDLGIGIMPTYSPDGKQLAFTWGSNGMSIMNLDGEEREVLTRDGWGAQWSPNGKWISYESKQRVDRTYAANITLIDVKTREKRQILEGDQATRYSQVYWNMDWSHDSSQICFKGNVIGGETELCITSVEGSSKGFKVITTKPVHEDFSWHPDGNSLLVSMAAEGYAGNRMYHCDLITGEFTLLKTQPIDQLCFGGVWSPDGKRIVFSSRKNPEATPWKPGKPLPAKPRQQSSAVKQSPSPLLRLFKFVTE